MDNTSKEKQIAALLSICSNGLLIILKLAVGFFTGSLSIISEALHSLSDIAASFIAYISVKKSSEPADKEHPFGHGKFEELSGFIEGLLILGIAVYIFYSACIKIMMPNSQSFEPFWGIIIMSFSIILNIFVSKYLFFIGQKTNSIAITADAEHLSTDVISSFAILVGLLIIKLTGWIIIDVILAYIVAFIIFYAGVKVVISATKGLLDETLPEKDLAILQEILDKHKKVDIADVKFLQTRKSGSEKLISLTITVHKDMTIGTGHDICNNIENEIMEALDGAKALIHLEPCEDNCKICK